MTGVLLARSIRDSWPLLCSCSMLALGFTWLRIWVASHIKVDVFVKFFSESFKSFQELLPVPLADLASPLGRVAFSFEEFGLVLLLGLWTITRASDCLAGRISSGTMEMLLAQPIRRLTLFSTHTLVTLCGVVVIALAAWCGVGAGLSVSKFDEPPPLLTITPAVLNFLGLGVFITGAGTIVSALCRTRAAAVGVVLGLYVIEIAFQVVSRLADRFEWMRWLTILTAYEPTLLTLAIERDGPERWAMFWQYNGCLIGLGVALLATSAVIFCHRDVPAPL